MTQMRDSTYWRRLINPRQNERGSGAGFASALVQCLPGYFGTSQSQDLFIETGADGSPPLSLEMFSLLKNACTGPAVGRWARRARSRNAGGPVRGSVVSRETQKGIGSGRAATPGQGRRPQPDARSHLLRFWPAATRRPATLTFASPRTRIDHRRLVRLSLVVAADAFQILGVEGTVNLPPVLTRRA